MTIFWDDFQQGYEFHLDFKTGNRGEKNTLSINAVVTITPKKNRHYLNELRNTNHEPPKTNPIPKDSVASYIFTFLGLLRYLCYEYTDTLKEKNRNILFPNIIY